MGSGSASQRLGEGPVELEEHLLGELRVRHRMVGKPAGGRVDRIKQAIADEAGRVGERAVKRLEKARVKISGMSSERRTAARPVGITPSESRPPPPRNARTAGMLAGESRLSSESAVSIDRK